MGEKFRITTILVITSLVSMFAVAQDSAVGESFRDTLRSGDEGPLMVEIPRGSFVLGGGRRGDDDIGEITIDYPLAFSVNEITLGQYRLFLRVSRSGNLGKFSEGSDELPVAGVSWDEAEAYVTWLSRETGHRYRLPSSSEWEFAARAGSSALYNWGDDVGVNLANCLDCKSPLSGKLAPVGSFKPNSWGLYDVHGNVWEWTKDCIDSNSAPPRNGMPKLFGRCDSRELRGGSAQSDAWSIRASARASSQRGERNSDVGFRVVMDVPL